MLKSCGTVTSLFYLAYLFIHFLPGINSCHFIKVTAFSERAQIDPPQYASELATHLKDHPSCSTLDLDFSRSVQDTNALHAR